MWQTLLSRDCIIKDGIDLRNMIRAIDFAPLGFRLNGQSLPELVEEYEPKEPRAGRPKKEPFDPLQRDSRCRTPPCADQCVCRWSGQQVREYLIQPRIFVWIADLVWPFLLTPRLYTFPLRTGLPVVHKIFLGRV